MEYRIFPPIGIARIGNSPDLFIGPESIGSRGHDLTAAGEIEVRDFKDATFRTRKQAARFHVYQRATASDSFVPAALPAGASMRWTVRVANRKDGIRRPSSPPDATTIPGLRPTPDAARANRVIDSGNVSITGAGTAGQFLDGTHVGVSVLLGELRTDAQGRLLVVGADGVSKSNPVSPIGGSFYNNVNWHDDVCDGTVSAEVVLADGTTTPATGAWVIVAPPDFTPGSESVSSLYDEIQQVAISQAWLPNSTATAFTRDVYPLLRRARSLRWSHGRKNLAGTVVSEKTWNDISEDYPRLAKTDAAEATFRSQQMALILRVQTLLSDYQLTDVQKGHLTRWAAGTFASDWTGVPAVTPPTPDSLTEAALRGTAGQGFFPGIEGGRILTDPTIYQTPFDFRIDSAALAPGDVTAMMAQPWQADFLKCSGNWWPSQRPDIAPQAGGVTFKLWARLGAAGATPTHQQLVDHVMQFGVVTPRVVSGVEVCLEEGRDTAAVGS